LPGTAADVEGLSGQAFHVPVGEQEGIDEVVDEEDVADLLAVTEERDRLAVEGAQQEVGDPALVLGAELALPVDAAHPEHHRAQAVAARVVVHVLVGRALRAAVRAVEVERPRLRDAVRRDLRRHRRVALPVEPQRDVIEAA
jgi:hypothetical protein